MRPQRAINFPYKTFRGFPCPIVTLTINGFVREAYVDSGAFYSIFSSLDADVCGINFKSGRRGSVIVGDGNSLPVYFHTLPVTMGNITFTAIIGFSEKLGVGFNLLGRRSFFEKFIVIFDDKRKLLTMVPRK